MSDREIILVADPMCSWCWGFAPTFAEVAARVGSAVPVTVRVGGLRPYARDPWDADLRSYIRGAWGMVADRTGQPFRFDLLEDEAFVYDTEPACRAVVTARHLVPQRALRILHDLHEAFYAQNRDITSLETLAEVAGSVGLDRPTFETALDSPEAKQTTYEEFKAVRAWGVQGFPTLLLRVGTEARAVATGYRPLDDLWPDVESWLAH